ncbi:hypothetical protein CLOHYLEM_06851 [[Clostridium] hylemonae DSM 15053]|uniref:Uncharacterized protein n=1 Tax=[Clostridium] hylemonae DSM 15053 TaxID=553973 RepID=C0C436_9FIRM|nr:hypothetical protein CLOHYLEM_06851 [[Clostridium] hylemonae DSM 15053]
MGHICRSLVYKPSTKHCRRLFCVLKKQIGYKKTNIISYKMKIYKNISYI